MSLCSTEAEAQALRFPRVSGDEPAEIGWAAASIRFSPRERG